MSDATERAGQDAVFDLLVVGAGPTGLASAIEAKKAGFRVALVDKGCVCNSIFHYPAHMTFFTTSELLEIGGIPFPSVNAKPTRILGHQFGGGAGNLGVLESPLSENPRIDAGTSL